jgi:hypothetical protein
MRVLPSRNWQEGKRHRPFLSQALGKDFDVHYWVSFVQHPNKVNPIVSIYGGRNPREDRATCPKSRGWKARLSFKLSFHLAPQYFSFYFLTASKCLRSPSRAMIDEEVITHCCSPGKG